MELDVVGLGVSTIDLLFTVDELPGVELVQKAHQGEIAGGGPVATAVVAASRLGARTAMLDRIGDDLFGGMILEQYRSEGVDTVGMVVDEGRTSSKAAILVRKCDGARAITYHPGDCGELRPCDVRADLIRAAKLLHVNGRHRDACLHAVEVAREAGVLVSFDGGAHRFRVEHRDLLPLVDICIVAEQYAVTCTGKSDLGIAADEILKQGPRVVVITQGRAGSRIFSSEGDALHQHAFPVEQVVDTTGAGDAYHGAFICAMAFGFPLAKAARYASAVGAMNTRSLGGRTALPTLVEVETFLQSFPD